MDYASPLAGILADCSRAIVGDCCGYGVADKHWYVNAVCVDSTMRQMDFGIDGRDAAIEYVRKAIDGNKRLRVLMDNEGGCIGIDTYHCRGIDSMGPLVTLSFHLKLPDLNAYAGLGYHSCRFEEEAQALAGTLQTQLKLFHLNPLKMPVQNAPERKVIAFPFRPA